MSKQLFTADYFINRFQAIPSKLWTTKTYTSEKCEQTHCAYGHLGRRYAHMTDEAEGLRQLFAEYHMHVFNINDGFNKKFNQKTPRARILAALKYIKSIGE